MSLSLDILVSGIVQGVGFRPFIKRIAVKSGVYGYVQNLGGGEVIIHVEGDRRDVLHFLRLFREERPPPAEIIHMKVEKVKVDGLKDFTILRSASNLLLPSIIPPDIGICSDCISEIDGNSRWSKYAFNSCAWCGPRYSMMYRSPYDRENTSMDDFPLCPDCLSEYKDVTNIRRFHAQGISCPKCGPKIWLCDNSGRYIDAEDPIAEAAKLMDEGGIIGIKGIGGFHIAALANDDEVINELRRRKRRPMKPFALMALDLASVRKIAHLPDSAIELISSPQRPILLLRKREDADVSELIAPGLDLIGVMLPYSGIHHLFLDASDSKYAIMTSGNYYNKPMEKDNSSAVKRLGGIVDYFLLHNREIVNRVDDSVLRFTNNKPVFLRRSRGYAPRWIKLPRRMRHHAIAFGAELQNVGGVGFGDKAILTQFIGDTDEYENLMDLDYYLTWFIKTYRIDIENSVIVVDKNPRYHSRFLASRWIKKYDLPFIEVQHHAAHAYAILAEYMKMEGVVIAIDGAGYGDDGMVWGGEVLVIGDDGSYKRAGHMEYIKMPGGDIATYYPIRMLLSILSRFMSLEKAVSFLEENGILSYFRDDKDLETTVHQIKTTKLYTSSTGRVLDAMSALLGLCGYRSYEGEPAMKLEAYSHESSIIEDVKPMIYRREGAKVLSSSQLMSKLISYIGDRPRDAAYTLQYDIGYGLGKIAAEEAHRMGLGTIYISGGASVNDIIVKGVDDAIQEYGIVLRMHRYAPPGDGCISLGQIYAVLYSELL